MERDAAAKRGGYSAASYINVIKEALPTIWEPGLIYMQDNASIHTARVVRQWLEDHTIPTLEWPPYSPDLNPIEHAWPLLKKLIYEV